MESVPTMADPEQQGTCSSSDLTTPKSEVIGAEQPQENSSLVLPPEEGWRGWLCVAGAFIAIFCTFGFLNAWVLCQHHIGLQTNRQQDWALPINIRKNHSEILHALGYILDIRCPTCLDVGSRSFLWPDYWYIWTGTYFISLQFLMCVLIMHDELEQ